MSEEHQDHNEAAAQPPLGDAETRESNSASPAELVILSEKSEEGACKNAHSWVMQPNYHFRNPVKVNDVILSGRLFHCGTPLKFPEVGAELPFKEMEAEICEQIRSKLSEVAELAEAILSVSVQSLTKTESGGIKAKIHVRYDAAKLKQYENPCDLVEVHRELKFHSVINVKTLRFFGNVCKNGQVCDWNESYADEHSECAKRTKNELESQITNALSSNSMFVVNKVTCELKEAVEAGESQMNAVICLQLGGTEIMNSMSKEDLIKTIYHQLLNLLQSLDVILSGRLFHCGTPLKFPEVGAELPFKEMEAEICEQIRSKLSEVAELAEAILSVSVQSLTKTESGGIKAKIHVRYDAAKLKQYENPCDLVEVHRELKFHSVINGMAETPHSSFYARPNKQKLVFYTRTTLQLYG
ncbi:hypothetical protein P879_03672 [Paragonimus westermani]|uniref:Uncharacterized protein n=1 Tax=Paragonimus westermani TaxID=34504 RepID=A0A8T0DR33_9TREM|nr:hypothetical protein P879_03672 [Paragonimus westermani]